MSRFDRIWDYIEGALIIVCAFVAIGAVYYAVTH